MYSRTRWLWSTRSWRCAAFFVVMVTVLIIGIIYRIDDMNVRIQTSRHVSVTQNLYLTDTTIPTFTTVQTAKGTLDIDKNVKGNITFSAPSPAKGSNLMIVSYMRSGSSMNGRVFAEIPENFFVFEPLIRLAPHHYLTEDKICEVMTPTCRSDTDETTALTDLELRYDDFQDANVRKLIKAAVLTLKKIYSCDLGNLDDIVLRTMMFEWKKHKSKSGENWKNFTMCYINLVEPNVTDFAKYTQTARTVEFDKHKNVLSLLKQPGSKAEVFRKCFDRLVSHCQETKLRVTKVLRLSMRFLPLLLNEIPNLKVLFIIRDPRGIMNSRITTEWYPIQASGTKTVEDNIKSLCHKIHEDVQMIDKLKNEFPGRILDFSLEDLVNEPIRKFNTILQFAELEMTDIYSEKVKEIFTEKPTFLNRWNGTMDPKYVIMTQNYCQTDFERYRFNAILR